MLFHWHPQTHAIRPCLLSYLCQKSMARQKGKKYESIIYNTNINFLIHTLIL